MTTKRATKRKPVRKPKKPQTLSPDTTPADPAYSGTHGMIFLSTRQAGVRVDEDSALTQSTVWACVKCISESLAGMPWRVGRMTKDGAIDPLEAHPLNWLLNFAPNFETQAFAFREVMWAWALAWGNGYAEIERDFRGNPVALWQLHPSRVRVVRDRGGTLLYEVTNNGEEPSYLLPRDMFHLMGPSPDGLVGWSVIRMHARTIGLAIAQEQNASSFNENDSTPGGVLEHPGKLSDLARKNLDESWARRHRGPTNRRTVAILEEGMKWSQTGLPPDDAKLVEQMQLTPSMICRIFGVPPHMVADLTRATFSNIENQDLDFVRNTLRPWAERGESEADVKLFGRNNQATLVTFIDLIERERGDSAAQTQHVREMIFTGVYSINEGRRYMGLQGIGPEGDKRYMQSAMVPLEDVGKVPPKPNPPEDSTDEPATPAPTDEEPDDQLSRVQDKTMAVLVDACRRMLKREAGQRDQMGGLSSEWLAKHQDYCREILLPASGVLAACLNAPAAAVDVAVSLFLAKHFESPSDQSPEAKALDLRDYILAAASAKGAA